MTASEATVPSHLLKAPPLSLYVHIPWCVRKCPYCDFNSHVAPEHLPQRDYLAALLEDLDHDLRLFDGAWRDDRPLVSIFFGGGTPSLFSPDEIGRFLSGARARIPFAGDVEVTLEANPGTIEHGRFSGYRAAGVTRVSIGAQTFSEPHLKVLGRIHGSGDIQRAVDELGRAGIDNFNLDLMYALPQQTRAQALDDVRAAIALAPRHISHYQLTLEPGTVFYHRPPAVPDTDAAWEMQVDCQELLAARGYEQYEVSAYARPGARCAHNMNYWRFGDYFGIGAGAHGKLTHAAANAITRTVRCRQPRDYLSRAVGARVIEQRSVAAHDLPFEYMLNALRLLEGFSVVDFEARTGRSREVLDAVLREVERKGLLARADEQTSAQHWRPTELGARFLNELQAAFLSDAA
jgi:oxygen-independent coproporphyrinogen-3 oxidase